jgi:DNA repair protein RAD51
MYGVNPKMAVHNNVMAEYSTIRMHLSKGTGKNRICEIRNSFWLPDAEATFAILSDGIGDSKE